MTLARAGDGAATSALPFPPASSSSSSRSSPRSRPPPPRRRLTPSPPSLRAPRCPASSSRGSARRARSSRRVGWLPSPPPRWTRAGAAARSRGPSPRRARRCSPSAGPRRCSSGAPTTPRRAPTRPETRPPPRPPPPPLLEDAENLAALFHWLAVELDAALAVAPDAPASPTARREGGTWSLADELREARAVLAARLETSSSSPSSSSTSSTSSSSNSGFSCYRWSGYIARSLAARNALSLPFDELVEATSTWSDAELDACGLRHARLAFLATEINERESRRRRGRERQPE